MIKDSLADDNEILSSESLHLDKKASDDTREVFDDINPLRSPVDPDDPDFGNAASDAPADTSEEERSADELIEEAREILDMGDGETDDAFGKIESAREIYEELQHRYDDLAMTLEGETKQHYEEEADKIAYKISEANTLLNQEVN